MSRPLTGPPHGLSTAPATTASVHEVAMKELSSVAGERDEGREKPRARISERDLLWVESVSERLLGQSAPRAWERTFFEQSEGPARPAEAPSVHALPAEATPAAAPLPPLTPPAGARGGAEPAELFVPKDVSRAAHLDAPAAVEPAAGIAPVDALRALGSPEEFVRPADVSGAVPAGAAASDFATAQADAAGARPAPVHPSAAHPAPVVPPPPRPTGPADTAASAGPSGASPAAGFASRGDPAEPAHPVDPMAQPDSREPPPFSEADADWRHEASGAAAPADQVIDLRDGAHGAGEAVHGQADPGGGAGARGERGGEAAIGSVDDEILRRALGSGDVALASAALALLDARARDRERITALETALRALLDQLDHDDLSPARLALTAQLLRRVLEA